MRTFNLKEIKELGTYIGCGSYGEVYQLDEFRVIKVFYATPWVLEDVIREIEGANEPGWFTNPCPILEEVWITDLCGYLTVGLIKPFIGKAPDHRNFMTLHEQQCSGTADYSDCKEQNYRIDYTGRLWRIDTDHREFEEDYFEW